MSIEKIDVPNHQGKKKSKKPSPAATDPIRFAFSVPKRHFTVGEPIDITVTADLLNVSPNSMFFLPGANTYSLKVLMPEGFLTTSNDLSEFTAATLTKDKPQATYHLTGYFTSVTTGSCFRLLRGPEQPTAQSLFEERATLCLGAQAAATVATVKGKASSASSSLIYVVDRLSTGNTTQATANATTCANSISGINYHWDGGNNSITIKVNSSASTPQVMWTGASSIGWTNTYYTNTGNVWQWAQTNMNPGNYTVSVRPQGDGGAGCSFNFSVPSADGTLYPTADPCSNPPAAPTVSASGSQVCNGSTVTLTASGCGGTVNWSTGQTGSSISVGAGTYSATCSANGCTSGSSSQVAVTSCPTTPTGSCVTFSEECSGNSSEVRQKTINVATAGTYTLTLNYRSTEGDRDGLVTVGNATQTVRFLGAQTTVTTATFSFAAGDNVVRLSSGPQGGYLCFSKVCANTGSNPCSNPPAAPSVSPASAQVNSGSTVTLTASGCGGTVNWSTGQTGSSISVGAGTYSATCSVNGCTSGSSNQAVVTNATSSGGTGYNRILYFGNSITFHPGTDQFIVNAQNGKRGMASTQPSKDYVHLMSARHQSLNSNADNRIVPSNQWYAPGSRDEATGGYVEAQLTKNWLDLSRFDPIANWKPDLIYIRLGENVVEADIK